MSNPPYEAPYRELVDHLLSTREDKDEAMAAAVGGEFEAVGAIERFLLVQWGLRDGDYLVDVGCGSGRLAHALDGHFTGRYLGTDVVPELLAYARQLVEPADWRFEHVEALEIPEADDQADMVAFFSVFTHLLHEHSYVYLQEAIRVLKPKGRVVFSFLEFTVPGHWAVFSNRVDGQSWGSGSLDMFLSRDAITVWAQHLGVEILAIEGGDDSHIELLSPVTFEDGREATSPAALGQSVCVLEKP
jgi:SAM-dependent methyltransferase